MNRSENLRRFPVYYKGNDYWITIDGAIYDFNTHKSISDKFSLDEVARMIATAWIGEADFPIKFRNNDESIIRDNIQYAIISKEYISDDIIRINGVDFKKIPGFKYYYIADGGIIYSAFYDKFMHRKITKTMYLQMSMVDDTGKRRMMPIHRYMWYTWNNKVPNPEMEINHIDGKEWHCYLSNLEEITPLENSRHGSFIIKTKVNTWSIEDIHFICQCLAAGNKIKSIYKNNDWIQSKIVFSGFKILCHHLIYHTKFWVDISSQYDMSGFINSNIIVSDNDVHQICKMLSNGLSCKQISNALGIDLKYVSSIKCRSTRTNISQQYNF